MMDNDTYIPEDMYLAVKHGAAWLDEHDPEWVSKIKLDSLQMDHGGQCILGQSQGCYFDVLDTIEEDDTWAFEHGFDVPNIEGSYHMDFEELDKRLRGEYIKLTATWIEYIQTIRGVNQ